MTQSTEVPLPPELAAKLDQSTAEALKRYLAEREARLTSVILEMTVSKIMDMSRRGVL